MPGPCTKNHNSCKSHSLFIILLFCQRNAAPVLPWRRFLYYMIFLFINCAYFSGTCHSQLRISSISCPYSAIYCLCSTSLSFIFWIRKEPRLPNCGKCITASFTRLKRSSWFERCRDGAFLLIAVNRHVVIIALIGQLMDQSRISVEREDYRLIWGEDCVILGIA